MSGHFDLEEGGGNEAILVSIRTRLKFPSLERLGIVLDADAADDHPDPVPHLWLRIRDTLWRAGYTAIPEMPLPDGTIIHEPAKPVVGVWLMPDNRAPGMLEDFCRFLISDRDALWTHALSAVQEIPEADLRFPVRHAPKANLHTWLAWQEEPGKPIGQAITKKYLDAGAPQALKLIAWLRALFDLPSG